MTYFRTLSQNSSEFVLFLSNFEELLSERKASLSPITGDFNARSSSWPPKYINTTEGSKCFHESYRMGFLN